MAERTVYLEDFLVQLKPPLNTLPNFGGWFCFISWQPVLVKLPILCFFGLRGFLSAIQVFSPVRVVPSGSSILLWDHVDFPRKRVLPVFFLLTQG